MTIPMISVVMPVFNGEKYLKEAIDSILNQTYPNFEFIILNDGSIDKTDEIISSYVDNRIRYIKNETNLQIVRTLNKGIKLARGKYIARMDADDISMPERLEKQVKFMEKNTEVDVCGTWFKAFGEKNYTQKFPSEDNQIKADLLFYTPIAHPTVMIKKTTFEKYQYSDAFPKAEDYALWIDLVHNFKFAILQDSLLRYRIHQHQTSSEYNDIQKQSALNAVLVLLKNLDSTLSIESITVHGQIIFQEIIPLNKLEEWLKALIYYNLKKCFFESEALKISVFNIWTRQALTQTFNGISTLIKFYSSSLYVPNQLTLLMHFKFIIKCLIRYSNKSINV